MYKSVVKLFWSYDIKKTESWLRWMNVKGYELVSVNFKLRLFKFKKSEEKNVTYRVMRLKSKDEEIPKRLSENGWSVIVREQKWCILRNEESELKTFPSRTAIIKRNYTIKSLTGWIWGMQIGLFVLYVMMESSPAAFISRHTESYHGYNYGYFFAYVILFVYSLVTYNIIKASNDELLNEAEVFIDTRYYIDKTISANEEQLLKDKKIVARRKFAWFYSPDKTEKWLERMEGKGLNLYKLDPKGHKFYFYKGQKKNIKYCIDFKKETTKEYIDINKEAGWRLYFITRPEREKWHIWAKEYKEDAIRPGMYTNKEDIIEQARVWVFRYLRIFIPATIISAIVISIWIVDLINGKKGLDEIYLMLYPLFYFVQYTIYTGKSVLYYFRVKKTCI